MDNNAAYSNWGWKNPVMYQGQGYQLPGQNSYTQYGQGQTTSPQWTNMMNQMTPYQPSTQVQGGGSYQMPQSLPMDNNFMQNYGWPTLINQSQAALQPQVAGATTAANMGEKMKVAEKMGWTTPAEASPSLMSEILKGLGTSLQTTQNSSARSGMPISSVTENSRDNTIQAAIQAMVRAFTGARQDQQNSLMGYMR